MLRSAATIVLISLEGPPSRPGGHKQKAHGRHVRSTEHQRQHTRGEHQHGCEQGRSHAELVCGMARDSGAGDLAEVEEQFSALGVRPSTAATIAEPMMLRALVFADHTPKTAPR